jgi:hypothetical protein
MRIGLQLSMGDGGEASENAYSQESRLKRVDAVWRKLGLHEMSSDVGRF